MSGPFTILIVEDDPPIRDAIIVLLREHGFHVLSAEDGYGAIRLLVEHHVDLLFTDVVLPGINGFELARQARLLRGDLRVLYLTGDAQQTWGKGILYGKILQKPVRADQVLTEVSQALAR